MYHFEIGRLLGDITHQEHSRGKELQIGRLPGKSGVLALYQYCNTKQQPVHSAQILVFVSKLCFLSNITLFQHGSLSFHITSYRSYSSFGVKGKIYEQNTVTMWDYRKKTDRKSDRQRNVCLTDVCSALLFSVWWFGAEQSSLWPPHHSAQLSVNTLNTHTDRQSQTLRQVIVDAHEARSCIFRNAIQCKLLLLTTTWEL